MPIKECSSCLLFLWHFSKSTRLIFILMERIDASSSNQPLHLLVYDRTTTQLESIQRNWITKWVWIFHPSIKMHLFRFERNSFNVMSCRKYCRVRTRWRTLLEIGNCLMKTISYFRLCKRNADSKTIRSNNNAITSRPKPKRKNTNKWSAYRRSVWACTILRLTLCHLGRFTHFHLSLGIEFYFHFQFAACFFRHIHFWCSCAGRMGQAVDMRRVAPKRKILLLNSLYASSQ